MEKLIIKSHKNHRSYTGSHFFILNKGLNSGKPLLTECPNSFVLQFTSKDDRDTCYWLAFSLWKTKFWHRYLVGSVILFLRIDDFKAEFCQRYYDICSQCGGRKKWVELLQTIEKKEITLHENLALLADMRHAILYRYIKNRFL